MKSFLKTWLLVVILGYVGFSVFALLTQSAFFGIFLPATAVIAGLITASVSLSDQLEKVEARLDKLEQTPDELSRGRESPDGEAAENSKEN